MANIHPTAIISPEARLGDGVSIGAYSIIKGAVQVGDRTIIHEHTMVQGKTTIGDECEIGPAAYVGLPPQHMSADREIGQLIIGNNVIIRETATVHRSITLGSAGATKLGDNCFIMASAHVGHDCVLGDSVVVANGVLLGGHCQIGDRCFIGGGAALHQHVRVGRLAVIGGNELITQEVPPFAAVLYGGLKGYNAVGCRRSGMSRPAIHAIRSAFRFLHLHRLTETAINEIRQIDPGTPELNELIDFLTTAKRGIVPSVGGRRTVFNDSVD